MKDGQTAYRQGFKAVPNIYFVLYGKFDYKVWEEVKNNDTETSGTEGPSKVVSPAVL